MAFPTKKIRADAQKKHETIVGLRAAGKTWKQITAETGYCTTVINWHLFKERVKDDPVLSRLSQRAYAALKRRGELPGEDDR